MHPTDQMSTAPGREKSATQQFFKPQRSPAISAKEVVFVFSPLTCHVVMHPVQHDLRGSVPAGGHVAGHLVVGVPRQAKVQDLESKGAADRGRERERETFQTDCLSA